MNNYIRALALLGLALTGDSYGHGDHVSTTGIQFYMNPELGTLVINENTVTQARKRIIEASSAAPEITADQGLQRVRVGPYSDSTLPSVSSVKGFPVGQVFVVVSDKRFGELVLPLRPIHAYASHNGESNIGSQPVGKRAYYSVPDGAIRSAEWFEIKRIDSDGARLIRRVDLR